MEPQMADPAGLTGAFWTEAQLDLNARRLEHLASLGLDLSRKSVLEVGGGIGDLTMYFLDRQCRVLLTDGRAENVRFAAQDELFRGQKRLKTEVLNLDSPGKPRKGEYAIAFCYGVLHLTAYPERALKFLAASCTEILLLECEIVPGDASSLHTTTQPTEAPLGPVGPRSSRPTSAWVREQLAARFRFVYAPVKPPEHEHFRTRSTCVSPAREVFIGAHTKLRSDMLRQV